MTLTDRWLAFGDRLYDKGKAIFDHSDVLESAAGTKDPKVVALTLLARTMGNFAGAVLWDAADAGGVGPAYIVYRELSGDSAHPSATSLSRHVTWNEEGRDASFTVRAVPVQEPLDVPDTLELACNPLLGICVAANQILGGVDAGESLEDLFVAFRELSDANKTARDAENCQKPNGPT